jgi:hypothetical protein
MFLSFDSTMKAVRILLTKMADAPGNVSNFS